MKKYTDPKMNVNVFEAESVATVSGGPKSYEEWAQEKNAASGLIDFASGIEVAVEMGV